MLYYDNILGLFGNTACSKRLELDNLCAPFQPKLFYGSIYVSMILWMRWFLPNQAIIRVKKNQMTDFSQRYNFFQCYASVNLFWDIYVLLLLLKFIAFPSEATESFLSCPKPTCSHFRLIFWTFFLLTEITEALHREALCVCSSHLHYFLSQMFSSYHTHAHTHRKKTFSLEWF